MKTSIIPVFIPHLGCPHLCTFCNQKKISGSLKAPDKEEILELVEEYLNADFSKVYEIAFFGGSFTALDLEMQRYYLETAAKLKSEEKISKIRYSTRPDYINDGILDLAKKYNVDIIELGLQSMDDKVLKESERGHTAEDTIKAAALIKRAGISLGLQIMPGLKGDTVSSIFSTIEAAVRLKPDFVRIYPTVVIKGTKLEEEYLKGDFVPMGLREMVEIVAKAWIIFSENGIKVIRMGLQHSENLTSERDLIAGPYHSAFGELVFSKIYKNIIIKKIQTDKLFDSKFVKFRINSKEVSKVRGHKNSNLKFIKEKFDMDLILITDDCLEKGQIETEV